MRKAKQGPALFELLGSERSVASRSLKVPGWWSAKDRSEDEERPIELKVVREREPEKPAPEPRKAPVIETAPASALAEPTEEVPAFEVVGGRMRVALTSSMAGVVVFFVIAGLLGSFALGRRSGNSDGFRRGYSAGVASVSADAMSEIEIARSQPPATHLVRELLAEDVPVEAPADVWAEPAVQSSTVEWVRDHTYIVVQEIAAGRAEDAEHAREYLSAHGIETVPVELAGGGVQLITRQGYNHRDPAQKKLAEELLDGVHRVGAKYFADGGGYRLQGYFRTLKGENW